MKRKSPITITSVKLASYKQTEEETRNFSLEKLYYKRYRDLAVDNSYTNIAVKLDMYNRHEDKGVRRTLKLAVVDLSSRYEVETQSIKIIIGKDEVYHKTFVSFHHLGAGLTGIHSYILMIFDEAYSELISMTPFQLHDCKMLGDPTDWFDDISGGIRPERESSTYRVLQVRYDLGYYVRFTLSPTFKHHPSFLPELKVRLYSPERMLYLEDLQVPEFEIDDYFDEEYLKVEFPLVIPEDKSCSTFYAELLCMGHPIAGFVFDTDMEDEYGDWYLDEEIEPLPEYTPEAASDRLNRLLGYESEEEEEDSETNETDETDEELDTNDFDSVMAKALNDFISRNSNTPDDGSEDTEDADDTHIPDVPEDTEDIESHEDTEDIESHEDTVVQKSILASLDHLTGLYRVKEKLSLYENVVRFNKMRKECGLPVSPTPLHAMFLGKPGTGKTTIAKLMGEMLHQAGLLSKGHVVVRERSSLVGKYYGTEEEKTREVLAEAQGGILFIDEAYQLYKPDDPRDPGKIVIESLLTALADEDNRDWMLILAGYPDETRRMFELNPGLKSRIPDSNIYIFDDFNDRELMEIAENYLARHQYSLTPSAQYALAERLEADYRRRDRSFGNARHVINLIQTEILPSMAARVMDEGLCDHETLSQIQFSDIPRSI